AETIQAEFVLKSELNLARLLLQVPKLDGIREDWLGEPWALIGAAPNLPISGFAGEPRLMIVDDTGKLDVNSIHRGGPGSTSGVEDQQSLFWKNALRALFERRGFTAEQYDAKAFRTPGNTAYDPADQVAVISDWIDADKQSYRTAGFDGEGFESTAPKGFFYNRPLKSLNELLLVPGMTAERVARIADVVSVSTIPSAASRQININTAPLDVLLAIGFPEGQATEIVQERLNLPITQEILATLVEGDQQLRQVTRVTAREFSIYGRVVMPNVTRWVYAKATVSGGGLQRNARIQNIQFY
ncbi:MAG: general secretion pathway protein GspK, partial [Bdellovibrionales bacterium]|nr:general secretion pathway protein GspK [Bdellovibrionales bacterium]